VRAWFLALLLAACRFGFDPQDVVLPCVPDTQVTAIDIGERFGCAQLADGTLACWGDGGEGQLGTGDFAAHPEAVAPIGLGAVEAFALGNAHACAIKAGVVRCWGRNHNSQLGINNATYQSMPVAIGGLTNVASVAAGGMTTCAVTQTGELWCWGMNNGIGTGAFNVPRRVMGLPPIAQVAISTNDLIYSATHACAVATDGSVWCWGFNGRSQLGVAGMTNSATPVQAMLSSQAQQLAIGDHVTCALLATREVMCWGGGDEGRLGDGTEPFARAEPALVPVSDVVGISAHAGTVCARTAIGELYCWGQNHAGQLVGHTALSAAAPVKLPFRDVRSIGVGFDHACALEGDVVYCWGRDRTDRPRPTTAATVALQAVDSLHAAGGHTCAHRTDNTIYCWGENTYGQLGDGTRTDRTVPVGILDGAASVATGAQHSCATDTSGGVHCWGYDDAAQVSGVRASTPVLEPTPVAGVAEPIVALSAGGTHTCARSFAENIWCWGWNAEGQAGAGPGVPDESPPMPSNLPATRVLATGSEHTCVIDSTSTLVCIGRNNENQIDAMASDAYVPRAAFANVSYAAMQGRSTCAITGVDVFCWGDNTYGQLGTGDHVNRLTPTSTISGAMDLVAGRRHACMRGASGQVMCWGANDDGQLGDGTLASSTTPVVASALANTTQLALGDRHTCALVAGNVVCVGAGDRGQRGDGTTITTPDPSPASISCPAE
jgi:alpha-tubulin suppressor-like RCC1 family protein